MSHYELTPREREVLLLAADGCTDKEIANQLGVARGTVATYWARLRERSGAINRAQAMAFEMARVYRETEAARARTADTYQALVGSLTDFAVYLLDENRTITSWNPGVKAILGYDEEEWIGLRGDVIFTPEDLKAGAPDVEQSQAELEGRALDERWHVCKNGVRLWCSGVMIPVRNADGEFLCFSKVLRDLTRFKRMEERLQALGENPDEV